VAEGSRLTITDDLIAGMSLDGRFMLITRTTGGLGKEAARAIAAAGAGLLVTRRDLDRARAAADRI